MKATYETDFYSWIHEQVSLIEHRDFEKMDLINLIEELNSLGNSQESSLESYLIVLMLHMLKVRYQPEKNYGRSWHLSIKNSKYKANRVLKKNPGLKGKIHEIFEAAYISARLEAAKETDLEEEIFPEECPWSIEEVLEQGS